LIDVKSATSTRWRNERESVGEPIADHLQSVARSRRALAQFHTAARAASFSFEHARSSLSWATLARLRLFSFQYWSLCMSLVEAQKLREERAGMIESARAIYSSCEASGREPGWEEKRQFDAAMSYVDSLESKIADFERKAKLDEAQRSLSASQGRQLDFDTPGRRPDLTERRGGFVETKGEAAFESYLRNGTVDAELRALQSDVDPSGGYLVMPQRLASDIVKGLDDLLPFRTLATKWTLNDASSLGVPTLRR